MNSFADLPSIWHWAISLWLAALGGCIGSFLNVVVYRLPAGKSLVHPSSHCPKCGHAIRWYDNVPVFGWLALGGKCRDCHEPIAMRYPLVEAVTAAMFFALAWIELLSDGANLPLLHFVGLDKTPVIRTFTSNELIGVYACHLLLLCTLLSASLIEYDRQNAPFRLFLPTLLVGIVATCIWPQLHPMATLDQGLIIPYYLCGSLDVLIDLFIALISGSLIALLAPCRSKLSVNGPGRSIFVVLATTACCSLILGYQPMIVLGLLVVVIGLVERLTLRLYSNGTAVGPIIWLSLLVPIWLVFWRPLASICPWGS